MKKATALVVPLLLGLVAAAQGSGSQRAVNALRKVNPSVDWNASSAKTADFDCDGKADTVMIGFEKGRAVVGVVWGSPKKYPQILTFPVGTPTQDGFSSQPKTINVSRLDCKTEDGRLLPGCKTAPECKAFSIPDDEADPFNFYWDSSHGTLAWWRL